MINVTVLVDTIKIKNVTLIKFNFRVYFIMSVSIFALVDGNSFYASCQIAFQPALEKRPVVVLSNNDGCIVAANQMAKNLNAELMAKVNHLGQGGYHAASPKSMMFQPYFKIKWLLNKHKAAVFSSNYELYGDMSNRMHAITGAFGHRQEIYSIDESFLDLSGVDSVHNLTDYGQQIKHKVYQDIGIPVAVGIGQTKTLAKLANHLAKKIGQYQGVLDLATANKGHIDILLNKVGVSHIWGIGKRLSVRLIEDNINTAKDLKYANIKTIRKKYGVVVERTLRELNGESCLSLEQVQSAKKQIISSRSFGSLITDYKLIEQAVISHTLRAAEKLRQQKSVCQYMTVYIQTNPFKQNLPQYRNSHTLPMIYASDNSILLAKLAKRALHKIWQPQFFYHKVGVMLSEITPKGPLQTDLFAENPKYSGNDKQDRLMSVMDKINQVNGKGTVFIGSQGIQQKAPWQMSRKLMSPRYTSRWDELLEVK